MLIWSQTTIQRLSELYTFDQPQTKKEIHESYSWSLGGSWFPHRKIRPPNQHQTPNGPVLRRHSHNLFARAARETSKAKPTNWWPSMGSVPEIPISGSQTLVGWVGLCENIAGKHGSLFFFGGGARQKEVVVKMGTEKKNRSSGIVHQTQDWKRRRIPFCKIVKKPMSQVSWHLRNSGSVDRKSPEWNQVCKRWMSRLWKT